MNKNTNKFNFKTFLMFLTMLVLSLSMVLATACGKGGQTSTLPSPTGSESTSDSTSEEEALTDEQLFANGDFEHPTNKKPSKEPITISSSSTKWTGSVDGEVGFQVSSTNVKRGIIDVETEAFNKLTNKPTDNPQTPLLKGIITDNEESKANEAGTRVLMLYNKDYAAQFVTSATSLKVPAGQYGKLTVWVYTDGLERNPGSDAGAYIKVKNTVANPTVEGTTYDPLVIENIDTDKVWTEYTIYLAPNTCKSTSFTVVLGIGEGNKLNVENHVKGFAFFDNVAFELISQADYDAVTTAKNVEVDTTDKEKYVLTDNGRIGADNKIVKFDLNEGDVDKSFVLGGEVATDATLTYPSTSLAKDYVTYDETNDNLKFDFSSFQSIGAAYTYVSGEHTLEGGEYVRVSFLAEIIAEDYQTKATITLYDVEKDKEVASFANVSTKDLEEDKDGRKFARFTFYIANNFYLEEEGTVKFEDQMTYQLKISFGPTEESAVTQPGGKLLLPIGTAEFKDFEIEDLTKENYALVDVTTDTRAKKATLTGKYESDYVAPEDEDPTKDETNDSYNVNVTGFGKLQLENGDVVSLNELSSTTLVRSEETTANSAVIGVVNSKFADKYNANIKATLNGAKVFLDNMQTTEPNTNKHVQALVVDNIAGENFVLGNVISISKNSTYVFSIRVYAHGDATAFVKLIDINSQGADFLNYTTTVTNSDCQKLRDGFVTVTFVITTGFENYDVRFKFGVNGTGTALFQSIITGSANSTYTSYKALTSALNANNIYSFVEESKSSTTTYYYASESHAGNVSLALKDENGAVRKNVSSKKDVNKAYATLEGSTSKLVIYNRLNLDDRYVIEAPATAAPVAPVDPATAGSRNYGWLQVTSIIIALVLVLALIAIVVRKSAEGKNKKRKNTERYYQGYDKKKFAKASDVAVPDAEDKAKDYDYDNPENN